MIPFAAVLLLQLAAPPQAVPPVLQFPEPGVDDPASYEGYRTRFYRDARENTLQIYINRRDGRVVHVWGNAANESVGFTVRDPSGEAASVAWGEENAAVDAAGRRRSVEYRLRVEGPEARIGRFLLGSMRLERDFQYLEGHQQPFDAPPMARPELETLVENLERLDPAERQRHLAQLGAPSVAVLRERIHPKMSVHADGGWTRLNVEQTSFDGRDRLAVDLLVDGRVAEVIRDGSAITIRSRRSGPISLVVRISTDAEPLTPLRHTEIFDPSFLAYLGRIRADRDRLQTIPAASRTVGQRDSLLRLHRIERQVTSLELLSSREKLMAGLPNYGTYFGRDMLMTALMMEPVWTDRMAEYVIGSVLGKLSPAGEVSHEEALGGQAVRENAGVYNAVMRKSFQQRARGEAAAADSSLATARRVLADLQKVRENYLMMDDDFQFPVFVARYLTNPGIPPDRKRAFLLAPVVGRDDATRLRLLLRNLAYVVRMAEPYARNPVATSLVGFPRRTETAWFPGSWRDSNVGYANGRFAMDINVVWIPAALESTAQILAALRELGLDGPRLTSLAPEVRKSALGPYLSSADPLQKVIRRWGATERHFSVTLGPDEVRRRVQARLTAMPPDEQRYWSAVFQRHLPTTDVRFLALSLDAAGRPIPVVSTDVGMRLYVDNRATVSGAVALSPEQALADVRAVLLPYPVGLFISGIGPVVANDAYASPEVWEAFRRDHYHSPRVVWGREVSLLLLGIARRIDSATDTSGAPRRPELGPYVHALRGALQEIRAAVEASGLKDQELWSYRIEDGRLVPVRYASSTDLQLWNLTDLVVQYRLGQLSRVGR